MSKRGRRRKKLTRPPNYSELVIGIADLDPEEWEKLRQRSDDAAGGYETYESWRAEQGKVIRKLRELGCEPLKVPVKVDELEEWLAQHNLRNTSDSRARHVALATREMRSEGTSDDASDSCAG